MASWITLKITVFSDFGKASSTASMSRVILKPENVEENSLQNQFIVAPIPRSSRIDGLSAMDILRTSSIES